MPASITPNRLAWRQVGQIVALYLLFSVIWIAITTRVLLLIGVPIELAWFHTYEGWIYLLVTSTLVFFLGYRQFRANLILQQDLKRRNRLYAVLSNVNQAIVRIPEPQALFAECCRIAVEERGFRMAWVGLADEAGSRAEVVAQAGVTGDYLDKLDILLNDTLRCSGPTGRAFQEEKHVVCNDIAADPRMAPWRDDALRLGYRSSAAFPLRTSGKVWGVFNLYANEPDFFDDEELKLLDELASNIAFALESADREAQRRRSEEEERRVRQLLQTVIDSIPDWIFVKDADHRFLLVNRTFAEVQDYQAAQLLGLRDTAIWPEELCIGNPAAGIRGLHTDDDEVMQGHIIHYPEEQRVLANGTPRLFDTWKLPLHNAAGTIYGVLIYTRDITKRWQAEVALRESEERLRLIMEATSDGIWDWNLQTNQAFFSDHYYTMLGYAPGDFESGYASFRHLVHPDDIGRPKAIIQAHLHNRLPEFNIEFRMKTKAGDWKWINSRGKVVEWDTAGNPVRMVGTHVDITTRKQAEEALVKEKVRAQVTLHSIGDAVITTDATGIVQYLNPVAEALTDWTMAEAHGQPLVEVFKIANEETRQPAPNPVEHCLKKGRLIGLANHTLLLSRTGREYAIQDSAAPIRGPQGELFGAVLVFRDVTEARRLSQTISYQAAHDDLTGLINRREFERRLQRVLHSARFTATEHALCYLDLDQFKLINDTCGHRAGDELLRQISSLLKDQIRKRDTLGRLGGDEFGVLMEHCSVQQAWRVADALRKAVENFRFIWEDKHFGIGVSIGLAPIMPAIGDITHVLSAADAACYMAKEQGRNRIHIYQPDDAELTQRHGEMQWATRIPRALEEGRFRLFWQPIVPVTQGGDQQHHFELLLRLEDEVGRLIAPGAFLASAERYNLSTRLDRWVIGAAFEWLLAHPLEMRQLGLCTINLSGHSMSDETFLAFIMHQLEVTAIPPEKICFEVTETAAIANLTTATHFIKALKARGCRFALDDFGSGFSSFAYLKNLPVDFLKIDGAFVKDIADDPTSCAIVKSINEIGQIMGKQTVAEFVETEPILEKLRQMGVDYAQGYFVGRPLPLNEMPERS